MRIMLTLIISFFLFSHCRGQIQKQPGTEEHKIAVKMVDSVYHLILGKWINTNDTSDVMLFKKDSVFRSFTYKGKKIQLKKKYLIIIFNKWQGNRMLNIMGFSVLNVDLNDKKGKRYIPFSQDIYSVDSSFLKFGRKGEISYRKR